MQVFLFFKVHARVFVCVEKGKEWETMVGQFGPLALTFMAITAGSKVRCAVR